MFTQHETHHAPQHRGKPAKFRRNDRRAVIARKSAFLIDGLTITSVH